jgi:hypothetical protein
MEELLESRRPTFTQRFGSSVLIEYVRAHTYADVVRELVQNEYDAGGRSMEVRFDDDKVTIMGTGRVIDKAGWARLSLMLGTGRVAGSNVEVAPKANGIGSKNFGLRSLFLLGDRIHVRSGGRLTILDLVEGALDTPIPDQTTLGRQGVIIDVPLRKSAHQTLPAFGIDEERKAFDRFQTEVASTLLKLASPRAANALQNVVVTSKRLQRRFEWRQTATLSVLPRGYRLLDRRVIIHETVSGERRDSSSIREVEYQRAFRPPSGISFPQTPTYFREGGGRYVVGVSMRLSRRRLDCTHTGRFYYPLLAPAASTGCAVSVNAPLEMDPERSRPLPTELSAWNEWLLTTALDMVIDLTPHEWFPRFGGECFAALAANDGSAHAEFGNRLMARVKESKIWPSAEPLKRKRHSYYLARQLSTPEPDFLGAFLSPSQVLAPTVVSDRRARDLARLSGSKLFTTSSLIRLRCAAEGGKEALKTRLEAVEADYHYLSFPVGLHNEALQHRYADAFDQLRLTKNHIADLKASATTLAGNGELVPGDALWVVPPELSDLTLPASQQLHPSLADSKVFTRRVARTLDLGEWVRLVAERSIADEASPEEVSALETFLLREPKLPSSVWAVVRRARVIRDANDRWVRALDMLSPAARLPGDVLPLFHVAPARIAERRSLASALRLRGSLSGDDLVGAARMVQSDPGAAEAFERFLARHVDLLKRRTVVDLRDVRFLLSTRGDLRAPTDLYIRSRLTLAILGDSAVYAAGRNRALYRKLGCLDRPTSQDIVSHLQTLQLLGVSVGATEWDRVYMTLVDALQKEGKASTTFSKVRIVFVADKWERPVDVLIGWQHGAFAGLVPVMRGDRGDLIRRLGGSVRALPAHWRALVEGITRRRAPSEQISRDELAAMRHMTAVLEDVPIELHGLRFLLDNRRRLHPLIEAAEHRFLIDDDPRVSEAIVASGAGIAFADDFDARALRFYQAMGVSSLTSVYKPGGAIVSGDQGPTQWQTRLLRALHARYLPQAIERIMQSMRLSGAESATLTRHFRAVRAITCVASISRSYAIGRSRFNVPVNWAPTESGIAIANASTESEATSRVAEAVAAMATRNPSDQRLIVDFTYRLLTCRSTEEIVAYLRDKGLTLRRSRLGPDDSSEHDDDGAEEQVLTLLGGIHSPRQPSEQSPGSRVGGSQDQGDAAGQGGAAEAQLPDLSIVLMAVEEGRSAPTDAGSNATGAAQGQGTSPPRSVRDVDDEERDRALGRRGEELVYNEQRDRLRRIGLDPDQVVWVSAADEAADHDILSVHDDGKPLFIEVKTTTGRHGRFNWPRAEFDRAFFERDHYELWRVYEGRSRTPTARWFADPVGLLARNELRVDLQSLRAEVESL